MSDPIETTSVDKTICRNRWNFPSINLATHEVRTCVRYIGDYVSTEEARADGVDFLLNNAGQKRRRLNMLKGVKQRDCTGCYVMEESGSKSPREGYEDFVSHQMKTLKLSQDEVVHLIKTADENSPLLTSNHPEMLEISIGNKCNFKCVYCSHWFSSSWADENLRFGAIFQNEHTPNTPDLTESAGFVNQFWDWFNQIGRHSVREIFMLGGEPLFSEDFYTSLERLFNAYIELPVKLESKVRVNVMTNLGLSEILIERAFKRLEQWSEIFEFDISCSFEAYKEKCEFIRYGMQWERFEKNFSTALEASKRNKWRIGVLATINCLSITSTLDFIKFIRQKAIEHDAPLIMKTNQAMFPEWASPYVLTPDFASYLDEAILLTEKTFWEDRKLFDSWLTYARFLRSVRQGILEKKLYEKHLRKGQIAFVKKIDTICTRRNLNFFATFPEYKDFYLYCKNISSASLL